MEQIEDELSLIPRRINGNIPKRKEECYQGGAHKSNHNKHIITKTVLNKTDLGRTNLIKEHQNQKITKKLAENKLKLHTSVFI